MRPILGILIITGGLQISSDNNCGAHKIYHYLNCSMRSKYKELKIMVLKDTAYISSVYGCNVFILFKHGTLRLQDLQ